jgi:hypothetical protein
MIAGNHLGSRNVHATFRFAFRAAQRAGIGPQQKLVLALLALSRGSTLDAPGKHRGFSSGNILCCLRVAPLLETPCFDFRRAEEEGT